MARRYAQIQDGRAHWIFTANRSPSFAPYITILDITDVVPEPQEGWLYDATTGVYSEPPPPPTRSLVVDGTIDNGAVVDGAVSITRVNLVQDETMPEHSHARQHGLAIRTGSVEVTIGGIPVLRVAEEFVFLPANIPHSWKAIGGPAVVYTVHLE